MFEFTKLYQEAKPKVLRYLYYQCRDNSLAEELTQETFYQAFLSLKTFKGDSKADTWVLAIARNVYLKHCRKEKHLSDEELNLDILSAPFQGEPHEVLATEEKKEEVVTILHNLPEHYRTVIIWREIEELPFDEIGKMLGKSPSTVRVLLFRAKKKFREIYSEKQG